MSEITDIIFTIVGCSIINILASFTFSQLNQNETLNKLTDLDRKLSLILTKLNNK